MDRLIAIDLQYSKGNYAAMLRIILGLALLFPLAVTGRSASVQAASLNTVMADLAR